MSIIVMIALVGALCLMAGVAGLQEGSADLLTIVLNFVIGLVALGGVGYSYLAKRRPR